MFSVKKKKSAPEPRSELRPVTGSQRLKNLERARLKRVTQLANPRLPDCERPRIEERLASISDEIELLKETV